MFTGIFMCLAEVMKERHTMTKLNNFFEIQVLKHGLKHSYSQFDEKCGLLPFTKGYIGTSKYLVRPAFVGFL